MCRARSATAWLATVATACLAAGCLWPGRGTTVVEINGHDLALAGFRELSFESRGDSVRVRADRLDLRVIDGRLFLQGRDRGPVAPGASIRLERDGDLFVDGGAR